MTFKNGDWVKRKVDAQQSAGWLWGDKPFRVSEVIGKRICLEGVDKHGSLGWLDSRFESTTKPNPLARFL